jgi:hypothetical protein
LAAEPPVLEPAIRIRFRGNLVLSGRNHYDGVKCVGPDGSRRAARPMQFSVGATHSIGVVILGAADEG